MFGYFPTRTVHMRTVFHISSSRHVLFFYRTQNGNALMQLAFTVLRTLTTTHDVNALHRTALLLRLTVGITFIFA